MIPALRRYARALARDADIADDLVQDTLVRALRSERLFSAATSGAALYDPDQFEQEPATGRWRAAAIHAAARQPIPTPAGPKPKAATLPRAGDAGGRTALGAVAGDVEGLSLPRGRRTSRAYRSAPNVRLARARAHVKASLEGERTALRRVK